MRITESRIRQIIREEAYQALREDAYNIREETFKESSKDKRKTAKVKTLAVGEGDIVWIKRIDTDTDNDTDTDTDIDFRPDGSFRAEVLETKILDGIEQAVMLRRMNDKKTKYVNVSFRDVMVLKNELDYNRAVKVLSLIRKNADRIIKFEQ